MRISGRLALAALFLLLAACAIPAKRSASTAPAAPLNLAGRLQLFGGDTRAWLTARGTAGDSGYCAARLKLPLTREPVWSYGYTAARFSANQPEEIVHYDGRLYIGARSPQILCLNATDGSLLFNSTLYELSDEKNPQEELARLFLHPTGVLVARDDKGRYYCWERAASGMQRLWLTAAVGLHESGFVACAGQLVTAWGDAVHALDISDGQETWSFPDLWGRGGIVQSTDGTVVSWTAPGDVYALQADDGKLLWRASLATPADRVVTDDQHSRCYIMRGDELLECRELQSGTVLWEYDWRWVLPDGERSKLEQQLGFMPIRVAGQELIAMPDGPCLVLASGDVLRLDATGKLIWRYTGRTPAIGGLGFTNAILINEAYFGALPAQLNPVYGPFNLSPPDWEGYQQAVAAKRSGRVFLRFTVLDGATGKLVDSIEPPTVPSAGPVPAGRMLVFGIPESGKDAPNRIEAYNWLEEDG